MKKLLVILLLMVYGTSSFGMTLHFHYCCGKLKAIDFTPPKDRHCGNSKMELMGNKPCCDDKEVSIKIKGEQSPAKVFQASFQAEAIKPAQQVYLVSTPFETKGLLPEIFAPPPKLSQPLFLLNCVFRI